MFKLGFIASAIRRGVAFLLDLYPSAAAAYSLRKLRSAYTGSAIRVRRSIDNAEQNIGFDANGNLDEASLTSFVGNGNAFTYSEQFDNAAWTKGNTTATANQTTAPDGATTADLIAETTASSTHNLISTATNIQYISGKDYTISCYFKKGSGATAPDIIQMTFPAGVAGAGQYANFNINTGAIITQIGGTATIESAANGFYRCSFTVTATATTTTNGFILYFTNNNSSLGRTPSYAGQTTSNVFAWGAQLNAGSTAQPYTATTANQAGFGYVTRWYDQSGTPLNYFTYSEQFDNAAWTKGNTTATANQTTAPDGTVTADLIAETTGTSTHNVISVATNIQYISGSNYTVSGYFKKGSGATAPDILQMTFPAGAFGTSQYANFNINTGVIVNQTGGTATIESAANGFYRCTFTATATATTTTNGFLFYFTNNNSSLGRTPSYTGQTTSNVFIWGAQIVQGSDALTYTKTEAANSNRDVIQTTASAQPAIFIAGRMEIQNNKPTINFNIASNTVLTSAGVLLSQPNTAIAVSRVLIETQQGNIIDSSATTAGTRQYLINLSTNLIRAFAGINLNGGTLGSTMKLIFVLFNSSSSSIYLNSTLSISGNAGTATMTGLRIGNGPGGSVFPGNINEVILYQSDQSTNRTGIESNINSYYTIY